MASLESRLAEAIQEDKSLPPLKVSLTKLTYNAVDRVQWGRHGKVTWAAAVKEAAIEEMFCNVQEHERLKIMSALVTPVVLDAVWKAMRRYDEESHAHDLYEFLGFALMQECGEERMCWKDDEGTATEQWARAAAHALWRTSLRSTGSKEGDIGEDDAAASPEARTANPSPSSGNFDFMRGVDEREDSYNAIPPHMRHAIGTSDAVPWLRDFVYEIRS